MRCQRPPYQLEENGTGMKKYFVSYFLDSYENAPPILVGNTIIEREKPIRTIEEVREIEEKIRADKENELSLKFRKAKITGWQKIK